MNIVLAALLYLLSYFDFKINFKNIFLLAPKSFLVPIPVSLGYIGPTKKRTFHVSGIFGFR
jgi:hypothetical protein